jgi:hypothetical protein
VGIYDEYRDGISTITLAGNRTAAAQYIPQARKFAEVIRGKLDLGTNLGQDYKDSVTLDQHTTMSVRMSPGVTNSTMHIEIDSRPPPIPSPLHPIEVPINPLCPRLPLSRPGARMFTHLFGHDVEGQFNLDSDVFTQVLSVKTQTPYITPTLEQGSYCSTSPFPGAGENLFHDQVTLPRRFRLMGMEASTLYLHKFWVGIHSPNTFLSFTESVMPLQMPCDCNFPGSPIFVPNPESLGPGNNFAVGMFKNAGNASCYPNAPFEESTYLVTGEVRIPPDSLFDEGHIEISEEAVRTDAQASDGELRRFALINWTNDDQEAEIVFMYESENCPAAVGFFYGGPDGLRPTNFPGYVFSLMCQFANPCIIGDTPTVPSAWGAYIMGAERLALAYTGCLSSNADLGTDSSEDLINGRSFWFEIDGNGFPNGLGVHNGPALKPGVGAGDLDFN